MRRALWVVALVTVSFGCGDAAGTGGTAGMGGTGGTAGAAGAGGSGGSGALAAMPPCLAALAQSCLPSGTCTTQAVDPNSPGMVNSCYGNGVKTCVTVNATANTAVSTVTKADGKTVCYKAEMTFGTGGSGTMSFKDAAGTEVATGTPGASSTAPITVICTSDGKTYQFDWSAASGASACTAGTCPCP